jgi:hypothetical protein
MATTTNYGWTTPDDTALVKDGASAIRTLGSSVDTTTKALNPSTTLGDIEYRSSTANTNTRLGIGTTGQVLTVSGGVPAWSTISAGGMTLISTTTLTGASITLSSIPSGYNSLELRILNFLPATDAQRINMRINGDTNTRYAWGVALNATNETFVSSDSIRVSAQNDNAVGYGLNIIEIPDYTSTDRWKSGEAYGINVNQTTTANFNTINYRFFYNQLAAITSLDLFPESGNFTSGTVLLYGVK